MIPVTPYGSVYPRRLGRGTIVVVITLAIVLAAAVSVAGDPPATDKARATDGFRAMHKELRGHLTHISALVSKLPRLTPEEQLATMKEIVSIFSTNIHSHAKMEDQALYPVVDKAAGSTDAYPVTATMRYEHRIVGRWISELRNHANQPTPDVVAFSRRADNLLGLISAHFEVEEDILLPVLDATMTAAQFKKEVLDKMEE